MDIDGDGEGDDLMYYWPSSADGGPSQITAEVCRGEIDVLFSATDVSFLEYRPDDGAAEPEYTVTYPDPAAGPRPQGSTTAKMEMSFEDGSWACRFDALVNSNTIVHDGQTITIFTLATGFGVWEDGKAVDVGTKIYRPEDGVSALTLDCLSGDGQDVALPRAPDNDPGSSTGGNIDLYGLKPNPVITANGDELYKHVVYDYKEKLAEAGCTETGPLLSAVNENGNWVDTHQTDSRFRFMAGDDILPTYSRDETYCLLEFNLTPDLIERGQECDTDKENNADGIVVPNGQEVFTTPIDPTSVLVPVNDSGLSVDLDLALDDVGTRDSFDGTRYVVGLRDTETGEHAGLLLNYGSPEATKWMVLLTDETNEMAHRQAIVENMKGSFFWNTSDAPFYEVAIAQGNAIALGDGDVEVIAVGKGFVAGFGDNVVMNGEVRTRNVVPVSTVTGSDASSNSVTMERNRMTFGAGAPSEAGPQKPIVSDEAINFVRTYANLVGETFGQYTTFTVSVPNPMQTPRGSEVIDQISFQPTYTPDGDFDTLMFTSREVGFSWETRVTRNPLLNSLTPRAEAGFTTTFSLDDSTGAAIGDIEQYKAWSSLSKRFLASAELQLYYDPETETVSVGGKASAFGVSGKIALDADTRFKDVTASTSATVGGKIPFTPLSISFDLGSFIQNEFWTRIGNITLTPVRTGTVTITSLPTLPGP